MPIDIQRSLTSVGVGVLDEVLEWWDEKEARTESFKTARDIGRIVLAGLGYGLQVFMPPRYAKFGETLAISTTPLLVKSIAKPVRESISTRATSFNPRRKVSDRLRTDIRHTPARPGEEVLRVGG